MMKKIVFAALMVASLTGFSGMPTLEPAFTAAQVEKGAPKLEWTRHADGSESVVISAKIGGPDLDGVTLIRCTAGDEKRRVVTYTLKNTTTGLRYATLGWRSVFSAVDGSDRNWFPTTDNVLDLTQHSSLWGYYTKPGPWHFALVEPWFAAYNSERRRGFAFLFDYDTLSAVYGANDMKTRGALFDGGMLPSGASITLRTTIIALKGLGSLATVNKDFAAGFTGPATEPSLEIQAFRDLRLSGSAVQTDVAGKRLGSATVDATLAEGEVRQVCSVKSEKPRTQTVLSADLSGVRFEYFRENAFRMASLPMVPPMWPHHRSLPKKTVKNSVVTEQAVEDKALLVFGFYANFFRFEKIFPELTFKTVSAVPQGIFDVPPATTIGTYKYIFLGDVNEESVRPMITRLASYVENGGTLVVGGGPFAYGCGGYAGTYLEKMLPVATRSFDCLPASAQDPDGRTAVAFENCDASVFWISKVTVKPEGRVLLRTTAGDPLLVEGAYGKGRVFAFLASPLGDESRDAKAFWNGNAAYIETMRKLLK